MDSMTPRLLRKYQPGRFLSSDHSVLFDAREHHFANAIEHSQKMGTMTVFEKYR